MRQTLEDCLARIPKVQNVPHPRWNVGFLHAVAQQVCKIKTAAKGRPCRPEAGRNPDLRGTRTEVSIVKALPFYLSHTNSSKLRDV